MTYPDQDMNAQANSPHLRFVVVAEADIHVDRKLDFDHIVVVFLRALDLEDDHSPNRKFVSDSEVLGGCMADRIDRRMVDEQVPSDCV